MDKVLQVKWVGMMVYSVKYEMSIEFKVYTFSMSFFDNAWEDLLLSVVRVGHCVPVAGFCLSLYNLHMPNREVTLIKSNWQMCICVHFRWFKYITEAADSYKGKEGRHRRNATVNQAAEPSGAQEEESAEDKERLRKESKEE